MVSETVATDATETGGSFPASDPLTPVQSLALGVVFVYIGQRYLEHGMDLLSERFGIGAAARRILHRRGTSDDASEVE